MGRIKSAWEIALEKTADIQINEEKIKNDSLLKEGMSLAGKYLSNNEMKLSEAQKQYALYPDNDKPKVREGILNVFFANLVLPADEYYELRLKRTEELLGITDAQNFAVLGVLTTFEEYFREYVKTKKEYIANLEEQVKKILKENPDSNPAEYKKLIEKNIKQMEINYTTSLEEQKEQLKTALLH